MNASKLKQLREKNKLTQYAFAERLGVKQSTVSMWENGENMPTADKLPKIAGILRCSIDELFSTETR